MNTIKETFSKSERLCSNKSITNLFETGNTFYTSLFKVVWGESTLALPFPAQVAFSVSKKGFKLAVTRNLIKRRMREAYRKNKQILYDQLSLENIQVVFVVIMKGNVVRDYLIIEKSMKEMIIKLITIIKENPKIGT
ncbi:MAG TPA: ribonuclease P protein component [Bacteroidales bacterium]|nr:ribonuclease P protein component [Bacteroidales bacterium]